MGGATTAFAIMFLLGAPVRSAHEVPRPVELADLPFAIELPPGFGVELEPGLDSASYMVHRDGEPYFFVIRTAFPDFDIATDGRGRVRPTVQQRTFCKQGQYRPESPPLREVLYVIQESEELPPNAASEPQSWMGYYDFIQVQEQLDLPPDKQAIADGIVSSIHAPGLSQPLGLSRLANCL